MMRENFTNELHPVMDGFQTTQVVLLKDLRKFDFSIFLLSLYLSLKKERKKVPLLELQKKLLSMGWHP